MTGVPRRVLVAAMLGAVLVLSACGGQQPGSAATLGDSRITEQQLTAQVQEIFTAQGLPVDAREYGAAAAILNDLGLDDVRLLTNNPAKVAGLAEHGVTAGERVPLQVGENPHNHGYLNTKRDLMGHQLDIDLTEGAQRI